MGTQKNGPDNITEYSPRVWLSWKVHITKNVVLTEIR